MPELPEVETTKTSLAPLIGATVTDIDIHCAKLRWTVADNLKSLVGYALINIERRAKYLILTFTKEPEPSYLATKNEMALQNSDDKKIIIHLGMSGSLQQLPPQSEKRKHDHVILHFINAQKKSIQLHYHDPRRFGAILWYHEYADKLFTHLGIEPLTQAFNSQYLYQLIHPNKANYNPQSHLQNHIQNKSQNKPNARTKKSISRPIKAVIMDQKFVVGVGNIYATESLFLSHIHPLTPADQLSENQLDELIGHIKTVLLTSIEQGGSTLKDFTVADGKTGYFQQTLNIYGKHNQPCPNCGKTIEKVTITGRSSTFCPHCQPYFDKDS